MVCRIPSCPAYAIQASKTQGDRQPVSTVYNGAPEADQTTYMIKIMHAYHVSLHPTCPIHQNNKHQSQVDVSVPSGAAAAATPLCLREKASSPYYWIYNGLLHELASAIMACASSNQGELYQLSNDAQKKSRFPAIGKSKQVQQLLKHARCKGMNGKRANTYMSGAQLNIPACKAHKI